MEIYDKFGKEIFVGSYIVYSTLLGRSSILKVGKVLGFKQRKISYNNNTEVSIRVIGIEDGWDKKLYLTKEGSLLYTDRLIVIDKESLPAEYITLFDSYQQTKKGTNDAKNF